MAGGISAGTAWIDIMPNMAKFNAAMQSGLAKSGKNIRKAGKSLTHHLTLPIVLAGAASIKLAADFDRVFEQMVGLAGVTRKEVDGLKDHILQLAPVVGKAPEELAKALYFLRSSGLAGKGALDALTVSAKLSAAGLGETEVVADAVSSAMNAYGHANLSASEAGDILAATVREGKGEADAIAPVLGSLLPLSQRLGVGFDQVGASIASMTRIGESAPRAATALRGFYTSLLNITPKVSEALKDVGLSQEGLVRDLQNPKKGLPSVLRQLEKAFGGDIFAIRKAFPNIRGLSGLLELTGKNGKATQKIFDRLANSTGDTEEAFAAITEGEGFQFEKLMATLRVAGIRLGNVLIPFVTKIAEKITHWIEAFQKLNPELRKWIGILVLVLAVVGPILIVVGSLITAITIIGGALAALGIAASLVIVALVALAVGFVILYKRSETFRNIVGAVIDFVVDNVQVLLYVFGLIPVLWATIIRKVIEHSDKFKSAVLAVRDAFFAVKDAVADSVKYVVDKITEGWNMVKDLTARIFNAVLDFIKQWGALLLLIIAPFIFAAIALWNNFADDVKRAITGGFNAAKRVVTRVLGAIVGFIRARLNAAKAIVMAVFNALAPIAVAAWNRLKDNVMRVVNALVNAIGRPLARIAGKIGSALRTAANKVYEFISNFASAGYDIGSALANAVLNAIGNILSNIGGFIRDKISDGLGALGSVGSAAKGALLGNNAMGTDFWRGGPTWVGEAGPEIVNLPMGASVTPNSKLGGLGRGRQAITISNWDEGTGYIEDISEGVVSGHSRSTRQLGRMRRP